MTDAVMTFLGNMAEYAIDEALQAFEDLERGANARGVIIYD